MKKYTIAALAFSLGLANAATPIDGAYSNVFGGYSYLKDNLNIRTPGLFRNASDYDYPWHAGFRIGYKNNPLRYELEYTYIKALLKSFFVNQVKQSGIRGELDTSLFMANVYFDARETMTLITPYLGVGLGYAQMKGRYDSTGPNGITRYRPSNTEFAWQAMLGLTYNFAENYAANLEYRFITTQNANEFGRSLQAHMASFGLTYRFDQVRYK